MEDDLVAQFTTITTTTPVLATQYLRLSGNDLEEAIQLFFANDGADLEPAHTHRAPPAPASPTRPGDREHNYVDDQGVVHIDSDEDNDSRIAENEDVEITRPQLRAAAPQRRDTVQDETTGNRHAVEDDEALARRLQEEDYGNYRGEGGDNALLDEEGYRAPMARTTQTLVGPDSFDPNDPEEMRAAVMQQMMARHHPRPRERHGIFNQANSRSVWENADPDPQSHRQQLAQATGGASESSSKANTLAEMYRPPFELISRVPWDEAREQGKENEKWILVNIQDASIFDCQVLNRDIWKNPSIMETVRENFIFMQYSKDDPRGSQYIQYYFQSKDLESSYPHIAIVDPRTGEQVKVWSGPPPPKAPDFLMQLHEFLDRYSLKVTAKNPVARRKPEPKQESNVDRMTEEQQMAMAMQASLAGAKARETRDEDPDELTRSVGKLDDSEILDVEDDDDMDLTDTADKPHTNGTSNIASNSRFASIPANLPHTEPAPDPATTTRMQFRHPNGRVVRRFALTDPVRRIYEWLKADPIEGKEGSEFELIFMQRNLLEHLQETIDQAGLRNGTIMVEFVES